MEAEIRKILADVGRLARDPTELRADADLYDAGLTSLACVNVMLAIEEAFDVEFPDHLLTRSSFQSIAALCRITAELRSNVSAA